MTPICSLKKEMRLCEYLIIVSFGWRSVPTNISNEQRTKLVDAIILSEAKKLQNKYSTVYYASDNLLYSLRVNTIGKLTGEENVHQSLEPLFEEYKIESDEQNELVKAFMEGFTAGLHAGTWYAATTSNIEGAGQSTTKLYRVMSEGEYNSLVKNGQFTQYDKAMESKWFATNAKDATEWGKKFYPDGNYKMVEIEVPKDSLSQMYHVDKLDGIGPAYNAERDFINSVIKSIREVTR